MRISKDFRRIQVEITNRTHTGHLESAGVTGRIVSYSLPEVMRATGLTRDELAQKRASDFIDDNSPYPLTIKDCIEATGIKGHVVSKGEVIR